MESGAWGRTCKHESIIQYASPDSIRAEIQRINEELTHQEVEQ